MVAFFVLENVFFTSYVACSVIFFVYENVQPDIKGKLFMHLELTSYIWDNSKSLFVLNC